MNPESFEDTFLDLATLAELSERIKKKIRRPHMKFEKKIGLLN
jgi:hypothetical protein